MDELAAVLRRWYAAGEPFGLATVVAVRGSAPRRPGAVLAVGPGGEAAGSVSGGCVDSEVYELARRAARGAPPVLAEYGVSDEDSFAAGLTCGGTLEVLVRRVVPGEEPGLAGVLGEGESAVVTWLGSTGAEADAGAGSRSSPALGASLVVRPGSYSGTYGAPGAERAAVAAGREMLAHGRTGVRELALAEGTVRVFVRSFTARPRMLVYGAVDFAAALARMGAFLGYRVTVCDARPVFATRERFPAADEVVRQWPHEHLAAAAVDARTVVCVLTHEERFDVPLLRTALRLPVAYVGAMGSRRTHEERLLRLREAGLTERELARLRSPIGLDLGGSTPEEAAVSIAAEIVAARHGGTGLPLRTVYGPIHRSAGDEGLAGSVCGMHNEREML
ncbi:XdhC family protein [Streptomyces gamaensis]|uniref:XdhC family protein n=1 Tax=Streptomyces gamaensis TaxID=1763542 RepID=A0ABW0Z925_9ACTN